MTAETGLLDARHSVLLVIDAQTRLLAAMPDDARGGVVSRSVLLLKAATRLAVPVLATRQYPAGLGDLSPAIAAALPASTGVHDKTRFSAAGLAAVAATRAAQPGGAWVIAGVEAHVCVLQTALELAAMGERVFVVADAIASRDPSHVEWARARLARHVSLLPAESVLYEWLRDSTHPAFRDIQTLIKQG